MKRFIVTLLIPFAIYAQAVDLQQLENVTRTIDHATQSPTETCEHCAGELDQESIHKSAILNAKEVEITTSYVGGEDYVIALKRDIDTPKKVVLKVEYGERVCARVVAYQNPLSNQLGFDCLFYETQKRTKTIHLDFSKASVLDGEESQSFRLVLNKHIDQRKIGHKLKVTNGSFDDVKEDERIMGMFGHVYEVVKKPATRAPAVLAEPTFE